MFDIGFTELLIIAIVGLLVIGPERLPDTLRTVSLWWARLKHSFVDARQELERELGTDEIKRQLHNESIMKGLRDTQNSIYDVHNSIQSELNQIAEESRLDDSKSPDAKPSGNKTPTPSNKDTSGSTPS